MIFNYYLPVSKKTETKLNLVCLHAGGRPNKYCTNLGKSILIFIKIIGFNIKNPTEISAGFSFLVFGLFKNDIVYDK